MVLKFSSSSKHYKGAAAGSPSFRSYRRPYPGFVDDTTFTPTGRPASDAGAYTRTTAAAANGSARAASSATWDMTGRGWPGVDEEDGGEIVAAGVDAAVPREWTAQVEPGVQITFVTLPGGGNDLKRIRFSREMFNKWKAQRWWGENYDRIVELYNVQTFSGTQQGGSTPTSSVDDSLLASVSISNVSDMEATEWIEQDEPGVCLTIRELGDGTRELRRVRFSRERFGEDRAKVWWEQNRDRIQAQYL
ncbi:unnamed protein product [Triticum turgidum subsp. durum]|uniref:BRX domain-containing protein n=1 Tax=Triticum turgidum subsp. durum TaxID=4567 RepID=A0A9R1RCB0_TRITD|nr:unnamed protein product [Triticum turgidum subsp. durum]